MWRKVIIHDVDSVLADIERMADQSFPNESGGSLMGYWDKSGREVVITDVVEPGPKARHARTSFTPDYEFQEQRIADIYSASGRIHTYLGDWHSHPNGPAALSGTDTRTLKNIASFPQARAAKPIMILLSGRPEVWKVTAWSLSFRRLREAIFAEKK